MSREAVFSAIYGSKSWGTGSSLSGPGSDPSIAKPYVDFVMSSIPDLGVLSVTDLGHGDWLMWPLDAFQGTVYSGIDVAGGLSEQVQSRFGNSHRSFVQGDCVTDDWPSADLVLCKDVLMHLSDRDVESVLTRLGEAKWSIICQDVLEKPKRLKHFIRRFRAQLAPRYRLQLLRSRQAFWQRFMVQNADIATGGYRPLDLDKRPWNLLDYGLVVCQVLDIKSNNPWPGVVKRIWLLSGEGNRA